jgi:hypothetical protein
MFWRKQMRISDLQFSNEMRENVWRGHSVELPKNDAHRMIGNEQHAQDFIDDNGDVEIVWNEQYKHWQVPAFAESRAVYCEAKAKSVARWGSN